MEGTQSPGALLAVTRPASSIMFGVGSRPMTSAIDTVKPTAMGGTVEKLEHGMKGIYSGCRPDHCTRIRKDTMGFKNRYLGESYNNLPPSVANWRNPGTSLNPQSGAPGRGGQAKGKQLDRPYTPFTIKPRGKHTVKTKNHTGAAYHGLMFSIRAETASIRITGIHGACGYKPTRELYRIYIKPGALDQSMSNPAAWREIAAGESELPSAPKTYGMLPLPRDGIKVQQGEVLSIYIHCPYNKSGVAFRRFAMAWPGYPSKEMVTDGDKNISIIAAQPTYSQTPFERINAESCAFAGIIEYDFKLDMVSAFLKTRALNASQVQPKKTGTAEDTGAEDKMAR